MKKKLIIAIWHYLLLLLVMDIISYAIVKITSKGTILLIMLQVILSLILYLHYQRKVYDDIKRNDEDVLKKQGLIFKYSLWSWRLIKLPNDGDERIRSWKYELLIYNLLYALIIPNIFMMLFLFLG